MAKSIDLGDGLFGIGHGETYLIGAPKVDVERAAQGLCGALCDPPCDRKVKCRGLCATHWHRWYEGNPTDVPIGRTGVSTNRIKSKPRLCKVEGCGRPHVAKGYCSLHYQRLKAGRNMSEPIQEKSHKQGDPCIYCGRPSIYSGLCATHITRRNRGIQMDLPCIPRSVCVRLWKTGMTASVANENGLLAKLIEQAEGKVEK